MHCCQRKMTPSSHPARYKMSSLREFMCLGTTRLFRTMRRSMNWKCPKSGRGVECHNLHVKRSQKANLHSSIRSSLKATRFRKLPYSILVQREDYLDVEVSASGFTKEMAASFDEAADDLGILGGPDCGRARDIDVDEDTEEEVNEETETLTQGKEEEGAVAMETNPRVSAWLAGCSQDAADDESTEATVSEDCADIVSSMSVTKLSCDQPEEADQPRTEPVDSCHQESADSGCDEDDDVEDLREVNRSYRPFRTEDSMAHTNLHLRQSDRDNVSVASSTIHPDLIKRKVKGQMMRKKMQQNARRIRKSGESSIITKLRRENQDDVKQSLSAEWY